MARDFIKIDVTQSAATQAQRLRSYVLTLRSAYDQGVAILAIMDHNEDNTVFTDIETLFGLPAGSGQTVFNLVNGSIGTMQGTFQTSDAKDITERVG